MKFIVFWLKTQFVLLTLAMFGRAQENTVRIGRMNVNKEFISVSGFSSGGTMAQHMFVSYSSLFCGIAVFSHAFYRCGVGNGNVVEYDDLCTTIGNRRPNELYDPNNALRDIGTYFKAGIIDNPTNMESKPLYVFAGTSNFLFTTDISLRILQVFERFIRNPNAIKTRVVDANLTLPSHRPELPRCNGPQTELFVSNCGFSGAVDALQFLLGPVAVKPPTKGIKLEPLQAFDQTEFFYGIGANGRHDMDTTGYFYVPSICLLPKTKCLLHFYFHGCMTGREFVGPDHIMNSGYLEVAEMNGIIMVFPQAVSSVDNIIGCWDTYAFTGPLYATQKGAQVTVVKNMLDKILGVNGTETLGSKVVTASLLRDKDKVESVTPLSLPQLNFPSTLTPKYTIQRVPKQHTYASIKSVLDYLHRPKLLRSK